MKTILVLTLFIFNSFSFGDELLTYQKGNKTYSYCVKDNYISNNRLYFQKSNTSYYVYETLKKVKAYKLESGYIYKNSICEKSYQTTKEFKAYSSSNLTYNDLTVLGLSNNDLNFLFALSGIMTSFIFLFGLMRWI